MIRRINLNLEVLDTSQHVKHYISKIMRLSLYAFMSFYITLYFECESGTANVNVEPSISLLFRQSISKSDNVGKKCVVNIKSLPFTLVVVYMS